MFTGIIERIGSVARLSREPGGLSLTVEAGTLAQEMRPGDSVAVSGACVTVERTDGERFTATVVPETLARTTLGRIRVGDAVNLERAMSVGGRFDGHFVQGHVDGVETILQRTTDRDGIYTTVSLSRELALFVAPRGASASRWCPIPSRTRRWATRHSTNR
jgi:riboflavin synthase